MQTTERPPRHPVLDVGEVAEALRISPRMVRNLIARGQLASFTIGRRRLVSRAALIAFVRARETEQSA